MGFFVQKEAMMGHESFVQMLSFTGRYTIIVIRVPRLEDVHET
jgi:hypothetical protein